MADYLQNNQSSKLASLIYSSSLSCDLCPEINTRSFTLWQEWLGSCIRAGINLFAYFGCLLNSIDIGTVFQV